MAMTIEEKQSLLYELSTEKASHVDARRRIAELETKNQSLEKKMKSLNDQLVEWAEICELSEETNVGLEKVNKQIQNTVSILQAENDEAGKKEKKLIEELETLGTENAELKKTVADQRRQTKRRNEETYKQIEDLQRRLREKEERLLEERRQNDDLKEELSLYDNLALPGGGGQGDAEVQKELKKKEAELQSKEKEVRELRRTVEKIKEESDEEVAALEEEVGRLQTLVDAAPPANSNTTVMQAPDEEVGELKEKVAELKQEAAALNDAIDELYGEQESLQSENQSLGVQLDAEREAVEVQRRAAQAAQSEMHSLRAQYDALLAQKERDVRSVRINSLSSDVYVVNGHEGGETGEREKVEEREEERGDEETGEGVQRAEYEAEVAGWAKRCSELEEALNSMKAEGAQTVASANELRLDLEEAEQKLEEAGEALQVARDESVLQVRKLEEALSGMTKRCDEAERKCGEAERQRNTAMQDTEELEKRYQAVVQQKREAEEKLGEKVSRVEHLENRLSGLDGYKAAVAREEQLQGSLRRAEAELVSYKTTIVDEKKQHERRVQELEVAWADRLALEKGKLVQEHGKAIMELRAALEDKAKASEDDVLKTISEMSENIIALERTHDLLKKEAREAKTKFAELEESVAHAEEVTSALKTANEKLEEEKKALEESLQAAQEKLRMNYEAESGAVPRQELLSLLEEKDALLKEMEGELEKLRTGPPAGNLNTTSSPQRALSASPGGTAELERLKILLVKQSREHKEKLEEKQNAIEKALLERSELLHQMQSNQITYSVMLQQWRDYMYWVEQQYKNNMEGLEKRVTEVTRSESEAEAGRQDAGRQLEDLHADVAEVEITITDLAGQLLTLMTSGGDGGLEPPTTRRDTVFRGSSTRGGGTKAGTAAPGRKPFNAVGGAKKGAEESYAARSHATLHGGAKGGHGYHGMGEAVDHLVRVCEALCEKYEELREDCVSNHERLVVATKAKSEVVAENSVLRNAVDELETMLENIFARVEAQSPKSLPVLFGATPILLGTDIAVKRR